MAEAVALVEDPHWFFMILIPFLSGKFGVVIDIAFEIIKVAR